MEQRFHDLLDLDSPEERAKWALDFKKQGGKVLGVFTPYVPEEIIYAAGMLPWRITGSWDNISFGRAYRPLNSCLYYSHILDLAMKGGLNFLDGIVGCYWDDDARRFWDAVVHLRLFPFAPVPMHLPRQDNERSYKYFTGVISEFARELEKFGGVRITTESLERAITEYNQMRALLTRIYEMRKRDKPPISGAEALGLALAPRVMPVDRFNGEVEPLLAWLDVRKTPTATASPRVLVASDHLDNPDFLRIIEDLGALVVMDDLDTGSRYFWGQVEPHSNPMYALSKRYITRPPCPRMFFWERQVDQIVRWAAEFKIDGVLNFPQMYSWDRLCATPYFTRRMEEAGIPVMTIEREYRLANHRQLQTRVQAFLEILRGRERNVLSRREKEAR